MQKAGQELAKNSDKIFSRLMNSNPDITNTLRKNLITSTLTKKPNLSPNAPDYTPNTAAIQQRKLDKLGR